jgi:arylsulfatase A-like enzyme
MSGNEAAADGPGGPGDRPRDVVLVTIDCWRTDTVPMMPDLREMAATEGYDRSRAVSQSASTNGAIPPLLASQHFMQAYDRAGQVKPSVTPLPAVLGEHGYATAAVVGSNPFIAKWDRYFDRFWNDGMRTSVDYTASRYSTADKAQRFLRLKQRVDATELGERAARWYREQEPPRFLWVHLMDIHGPYFPGLGGAREVGLFRTYATLFDYHVRKRRSPQLRERLRELYDRCVRRLDARLSAVFGSLDPGATVIVTGDHGEEFDHGLHGHARLYDECVTTPLFAKKLGRPIGGCDVRHMDLAPTILAELGIERPPEWEGRPVDGTTRRSMLANHAPLHDRSYVGVRTDRHKFIKSFHDERWTVEDRELYCHETDPGERNRLDDPAVAEELEAAVDGFLDREDVGIGPLSERTTGIDDDVKNRLEELGYV